MKYNVDEKCNIFETFDLQSTKNVHKKYSKFVTHPQSHIKSGNAVRFD